MSQQFTKIGLIVLILVVVVIAVIVAVSITQKNIDQNANKNKVVVDNLSLANENSVAIVASPRRAGVTEEQKYETKASGERCAVVDLNDYEPTKNIATKTYEWIIKFPTDDCVIQKPATNLPETISDLKSDTIQGTDYRRIVVSYQ